MTGNCLVRFWEGDSYVILKIMQNDLLQLGIARVLTHLSDFDQSATVDKLSSDTDKQSKIQNQSSLNTSDVNINTFLSIDNAKENRRMFKQDHFLT